ncbi:hypothetical protein Ancab_024877 [Ancistrocladus abbreviatus]
MTTDNNITQQSYANALRTGECLYFPGEDCRPDWGNKIVDSHGSSSSSKGFAVTGEPSCYGRASNCNASKDRLCMDTDGGERNKEIEGRGERNELSSVQKILNAISKTLMHKGPTEGEAQLGGFESPRNKQMDVERAMIVLGCGLDCNRSGGKPTKIFIGPSTASGHVEDTEVVIGSDKNDSNNPPKTRPIKAGFKKPNVKVRMGTGQRARGGLKKNKKKKGRKCQIQQCYLVKSKRIEGEWCHWRFDIR